MMRSQRGAAMVEAAIVALLFFIMVFAFIEYATVLRTYNAVDNAARNGFHAGVQASGTTNDDVLILRHVRDELRTEVLARVRCVIVYEVPTTGAFTPTCSSTSCPARCNRYSAAQIRALSTIESSFGTTGGPDCKYPPEYRSRVRNPDPPSTLTGPDRLGVVVQINYSKLFAGLFPAPSVITQSASGILDATLDSGVPPATGVTRC